MNNLEAGQLVAALDMARVVCAYDLRTVDLGAAAARRRGGLRARLGGQAPLTRRPLALSEGFGARLPPGRVSRSKWGMPGPSASDPPVRGDLAVSDRRREVDDGLTGRNATSGWCAGPGGVALTEDVRRWCFVADRGGPPPEAGD